MSGVSDAPGSRGATAQEAGNQKPARKIFSAPAPPSTAASAALAALVSSPPGHTSDRSAENSASLRADKEVLILRVRELEAEVAKLKQELAQKGSDDA